MRLRLTALVARLRDERGFTLMEVLVAMVAGIIVTGALFAILEISLKQNSRITDRVESQQLGSAAMTKIIDPLRSGCLAREAKPVLEGSTPTTLIFTGAFSEGTTPEPKEVFKETIKYESHKLTATVQRAGTGAWPKYEGWETGKKSVIAENVYLPATFEKGPFKYFKYTKETAKASTASSTTGLSALEELTPAAGGMKEEAKTVAGVEVGFEALPSNGDTRQTRASQFSDQVTFAFSSPNSEATIKAGPCE
jgi:prepilin-type N-terminal cleavage/methylation domain-containing protein